MSMPARLREIAVAGRFLFAGFLVLFALGALAFSLSHRAAAQPIAFNHAKHVQSGLACTDCHAGVEKQARATLPTLSTCLMCHDSAVTKNPEEEKIRTLAAAKKELVWTQLTHVPDHVYFSHRRHVVQAGLPCAECHGPVQSSTVPPTAVFRPMTMKNCIQCHEQKKAGTDCDDCHR
jgi:hypothetical protein